MAVRSLVSYLGRRKLQFQRNSHFMSASSLASQFKGKAESSLKSAGTTPNLKNKILKLKLPEESAASVLQSWVDNGHKVTFSQLRFISQILVNSKRYRLALEKVDDLKEAERVFLDWELKCRNYDIRVSNVLLGAYVRKGMIKRAGITCAHIEEG